MDSQTKEKILEVIVTADGGCPNCVTSLWKQLKEKFSDEEWSYEDVGKKFQAVHGYDGF
jgi:hypothetical protein